MLRFTLMSRLGFAEVLVRLERRLESSNRAAARRPAARDRPTAADVRRPPLGLTDTR